ncbi:hypothetical protein MAC_06587 [Metarhizium acridum CQMa 102]|uniref:Uncharacterized protein n=1 Tax=Metarhizium acridum (strain CQMa 102) TaxID=655827 RepID=E9E9N9_METAQ|nr:uncharacterized protein MAC_06587 [Metarhizium acridum CQMa 102]EFY87352.1 hypothetical protein MAC_06587 [Metarhizium acridum CQMa 102]
MSDEGNTALAALSALLGYVGAEAATVSPFEHLLWPNRYLCNLSVSSVFAIVVLTPMGGPMHKAALEILDTLYTHGLFQGQHRGHMLGTAFFKDIGWTHTLCSPGQEPRTKPSRNCLWAMALALLHVPDLKQNSQDGQESPAERQEKGMALKNTSIRAWTSVHHLTFSPATIKDKNSSLPFVREDAKTPNVSVFAAIILGELTAIVTAVVLIAVARTPWAALWLAPLALRLLSAVFTLHREPLIPVTESMAKDENDVFEINCPQSSGSFMIFTGPPAIVSQFMRHYGHPVRHRAREIFQLVIVVLLGGMFPLGLTLSTLLMSRNLQYVWIGYQIYLVAVLHLARYSQLVKSVSTHAAIADAFDSRGGDLSKGQSILFGQARHGPETIRVDLVVTYHQRYQEGKEAAERLLGRRLDLTDDDSSQDGNAATTEQETSLDMASTDVSETNHE